MALVTTTDVRLANLLKVYSALRVGSPMTKRQLAKEVELTFASVSSICNQLVDQGLARYEEESIFTGGRKAIAVEFVPEYAYALVLDMHHTEYIAMALVDLANTIVKTKRMSLPDSLTIEGLMDSIRSCSQSLLAECEGHLYCLSVGVSAVYNEQSKILLQASNPLLERVNLAMHLQSVFPNLPVLIENDANLAAFSQLDPFKPGHKNQLFVFFTQGIGLGIIIDGELYRGSHGFAGELGHLKLTGVDRKCSKCGNNGCMRTVVPLAAIARDLGEYEQLRQMGSLAYCDTLLSRLKDHEISERIEYTAQKIGEVLAEMFDVLNPDQIILGGNNWKLYPVMSKTIRQTCRQLSNLAREVDIQIQFVSEPINDLIFKGAGEKAFRFFTASGITGLELVEL
ncbi:ROK family protein [Sphaerochaeta sp. S2]|uniref:ROK family protein n=1 Tax=Sphaerochaeta sp. S2 TaxID=2798868 RepID=UPI0018E95D1F|nr:ROK family protein [Sphaerochaeta sp. S2]MBJ2356369.1 ROK family protein [Sphaerochaeta sp. S2]